MCANYDISIVTKHELAMADVLTLTCVVFISQSEIDAEKKASR